MPHESLAAPDINNVTNCISKNSVIKQINHSSFPETELVFVQISDSLMMSGDADGKWIDDYYAKVYKHMPGYRKPEHFMEIPLWISVISGMADNRLGQKVHIVTDIDASSQELADTSGTLLFSTIESNLEYTRKLVGKLPHKRILMGGHVNPEEFESYPNVTFLDSPDKLVTYLPDLDINGAPNNKLFSGQEVIPRLTLSKGCLFSCEFCMVPRKVDVVPEEKIWEQVESFKPLGFELVYIDDKTFGQASNWRMIDQVRDAIRTYNSNFKGFIIQTVVSIASGDGRQQNTNIEDFQDLGVKYVEIGVESVNPATFRAMNKPFRPSQLQTVMEKARAIDMPILPNFIFGHPLDANKYGNFIAWVKEHEDIIPAVNVNFLSVLFGATRLRKQRGMPEAHDPTDNDQNAYRKSWLTRKDTVDMLQSVRGVYYITSGEDFYPKQYADILTQTHIEDVISDAMQRAKTGNSEATKMPQADVSKRPLWRDLHSKVIFDETTEDPRRS